MSNIRDRKSNLFGRISSFRTFLDEYPQLYQLNSWRSIDSSGDQMDFIIDLFTALGSTDHLQNVISRIILDKLDVIELEVKDALKRSLKSNICCNINPSLWEGIGEIHTSISEFDLLNIFQINPRSEAGRSCYFDTDASFSSKDMNVFLYHVITEEANKHWFQYTTDEHTRHLTTIVNGEVVNKKIGDFSFEQNKNITTIVDGNEVTRVNENVVTLAGNFGGTNGYTHLNDWTDDYIDSVKFFDKQTFVTQLMGKIFGAYGGRGLSTEQIVLQEQIEIILSRLSACAGSSGETDDSFFTFDNTMYSLMVEQAEIKKVGNFEYSRSTGTAVRISLEDITKAFEGLEQSTSLEEQRRCFDNAMNSIIDQVSVGNPDVNEGDREQFKQNLLKRLLDELSLAFGMLLVSPKIYLVILVNMRLMGIKDNYDAVTFIRDNLNLVNDIVGAIKDAILKELMKEIRIMVGRLAKGIGKEIIRDNKIKFRKTLRGLIPFGNSRMRLM